MWFVYIAEFKGGKLYTGITTDPERRIREHNAGVIGAKSLRGKGPVTLLFVEEYIDRSVASIRESEIKKLKREEKLKLVTLNK